MKFKKYKWISITASIFCLIILGFANMVRLHIRQEQLDFSLVLAIKQKDTQLAISLLNQGADSNVIDMRPIPFTWQTSLIFFKRMFQGKSRTTSSGNYNSALSLYYGEHVETDGVIDYDYITPENVALIKALLDHGADPNSRNIDKSKNTESLTPLHKAVRFEHVETVRMLLENHADPNCRTASGLTPLFWASSKVTPILIENGANVNARDNQGSTPLMIQVFGSNLDSIKVLVKHGADVNAYDHNCQTAAQNAAFSGHVDILDYLYKNNAKLDVYDKQNSTLLILASDSDSSKADVIEWLLKHGANVDAKDKNGKTALDYALKRGHKEIVRLLKVAEKSSN